MRPMRPARPVKPVLARQATADLRERLRGLAPDQAGMLRRAMRLVGAGDRLTYFPQLTPRKVLET